jgi:hypothetical protein
MRRRGSAQEYGAIRFPSAGQWNVALKVHSVVEDAYDFDRAVWGYSVYQEVSSTTTPPRNVERPKTRYDLVSGLGARVAISNRRLVALVTRASLSSGRIIRSRAPSDTNL